MRGKGDFKDPTHREPHQVINDARACPPSGAPSSSSSLRPVLHLHHEADRPCVDFDLDLRILETGKREEETT
ncbi:hypothetical protein CMV_018102 [Castanea mollissima]|uniref:Uncharacterized protein n=1 Tax=Castanea mollissima TaxID=60419 RepID=A0A8J4QRR4_9ROSI|nr:hypothetical protein CMV_018102 [Castanea mollissima]